MATLDRLERLTDLVLVLLHARRPLTLDEISHEVPGYPEGHEARRQAFERDKRLLRAEGIPVLTEALGGQEQYGYRIDPDSFYVPDLGLLPDEQAALRLAVAGVELGDPSAGDALAKLGATGVAEGRPVAALAPPPALVPLFDAVRSRAEVSFGYRGEERSVAPAGLWFRGGRWYLVGWDRAREAARTFRVDRMETSPRSGAPGSAALPEGFDAAAAAPEDPWRVGEGDEDDVLLAVDAVEASRVVGEVGERAVEERRSDGSVVLRLGATSIDSLRSWVLGLLDHAEVLAPPRARAAMVAWLEAVVGSGYADPTSEGATPGGPDVTGRDLVIDEEAGISTPGGGDAAIGEAAIGEAADGGTADGGAADGGAGAGSATPVRDAPGAPGGLVDHGARVRDASHRLRRLLAIVGWLAEVGEAPIADVARRFSIPEDEVVHELELAACCGLPPYSPDVLLEIVVTDETVEANLGGELARPRRLTPAEGFALAAAARTIQAVPGADEGGSLARALVKLDAALGSHQGLVVDLDDPPLLAAVRQATDDRCQVEIEYHSASTDETTRRVVDPLAVVSLDGHWYLDAFCHTAGGLRRFRVDRVRTLEVLGPAGHRGAEPGAVGPHAFVPGPGAVTVRLALGRDAAWVVDTVPVLDARPGVDEGQEVTLAVGGTAWLERLLLQVGPNARVLSPPDLVGAGPRAARRVLRRYGISDGAPRG